MVSYLNAVGNNYTSDVSTFSVTTPGGIASGDMAIIQVSTASSTEQTFSPPAGAVQIFAPTGTDSAYSAAWYLYFASTVPSTISVGMSTPVQGTIAVMYLRDFAPDQIVDAGPAFTGRVSGSSTTNVVPSITTTTTNAYIIGGLVQGSGSATWTPPSGWTVRFDGTRRNCFLATKGVQASAGSTGSATWTMPGGNAAHAGWQMAIRDIEHAGGGGTIDIDEGPIYYKASGSSSYETATTAWSFTPDSETQAGDFFVVQVYTQDNSATITRPSGAITIADWISSESGLYQPGQGDRTRVFGWFAPSNNPGPVTIGVSTAVTGTVTWARFQGVDPSDPIDDVRYDNEDGAVTHAELSLPDFEVVPDAYIVMGLCSDSGGSLPELSGPPGTYNLFPTITPRKGAMALRGAVRWGMAGSTSGWGTDVGGTRVSPTVFWTVSLRPFVEDPEPDLPTLVKLNMGIPTDTQMVVTTKTADATSVRLKVGTNNTVTSGVVWGASQTPGSGDWARLVSGTLAPDTQYWAQVEMTYSEGTALSSVFGPFRTAPTPGTPTSFSFIFGGDLQEDQSNVTAFSNMNAHMTNVRFFISTGDTHDGDNTSTSTSSHRADWENIWDVNAGFRNLTSNLPFAQTYGDHDQGGGNNAPPGAWTAPNIEAYQQVIPYPVDSPMLPNNCAWSFVWGRVRFIGLDNYHERTSTYKLSPAQMEQLEEWLNDPDTPVKFIALSAVWYDTSTPEGWPEGDGWADYPAHRTAIINLINAAKAAGNTVQVVGLHGDQHALAAMSASGNSAFGGFPVYGGSPLSAYSSHKGNITPDQGRWPLTTGTLVQQHAVVDVTDNGSAITVTYKGYDSGNTVRVTHTTTVELNDDPTITVANLTAPSNRWQGKGGMRVSWWDGEKWAAILPTNKGHVLYPDLENLDVFGPVIDSRQDSRINVLCSGTTTLNVLRAHTSATLFSSFDMTNDYAPIVVDASVPLTAPNHDASPTALARSSNGYLWAANMVAGVVRITRSLDAGATWDSTYTLGTFGSADGAVGIAVATVGGVETVVVLASANDGVVSGLRGWRIAASASSLSSGWTTTNPPSPNTVASDDHLDLLTVHGGRLLAVTKTTNATTDMLDLLYSTRMDNSGNWEWVSLEKGPDDDIYTRPHLAVEPGGIRAIYGEIGSPRRLYTRTSPALSSSVHQVSWSARSVLDDTGNRSDGAVAPAPHCIAASSTTHYPLLSHDRDTSLVSVLWIEKMPIPEAPPFKIGTKTVTNVRLGTKQVTGVFLGNTPLF